MFWIYLKKSLVFNISIIVFAILSLINFMKYENYYCLINAILVFMFMFKGYVDFKQESYSNKLFDKMLEELFNGEYDEKENDDKKNKRNRRR